MHTAFRTSNYLMYKLSAGITLSRLEKSDKIEQQAAITDSFYDVMMKNIKSNFNMCVAYQLHVGIHHKHHTRITNQN